jgi:hypothetical protein
VIGVPRYSYPGVYIEEFSPATAIEGVATFAVGVLVGIAVSMLAERLRQRCRET